MDDREFADVIYQHWTRTTGANDRFWMPVEYEDGSGRWRIYAVAEDETRTLVASGLNEKDADFMTAIHGCTADLVRRLQDSLDEADRLDTELDTTIGRVARLEEEADDLNAIIEFKETQISEEQTRLSDERGYSSYLQCDINDLTKELESERADAQMWRSTQAMLTRPDHNYEGANYFHEAGAVYPFGRQV